MRAEARWSDRGDTIFITIKARNCLKRFDDLPSSTTFLHFQRMQIGLPAREHVIYSEGMRSGWESELHGDVESERGIVAVVYLVSGAVSIIWTKVGKGSHTNAKCKSAKHASAL